MKKTLFIIMAIFSFWGCKQTSESSDNSAEKPLKPEFIADIDLEDIKERGYLTAIIDNSSTGLFIYKGQPMGYEYELLKIFCDKIGVELRLEVTPSLNEGFNKLNQGAGDILAYNLAVTKDRKERVNFTHYHNLVKQVLVQRKPANWRDMKLHEIERELIRNPIELIGKEVYVRNGSSYLDRMQNLSEEIGGDILIIEDFPDVETEALIRKVATGEVEYTVADEDIARVNASYYPILDVNTPLSLPQQIAWGVRKNADGLLEVLNDWILEMRKKDQYYVIYDKYFRSTKKSRLRVKSEFFTAGDESLSPYDSLIKDAAKELGWDWRLLAAQIFKESRFDPNAVSWAGAQGLMQLLPATAEAYGASDLFDPEESIEAGKNYLLWLDDFWKPRVTDSLERRKFVLASYNVGQGHVLDAVRLTKKYERDTATWQDNVAFFLLQKSYTKYFTDPVVKHGYCRGIEPVNYVEDIFSVYMNYRDIIRDEEQGEPALVSLQP